MLDKTATRLGNWVAYGRFPQYKCARSLARQDPTNVGKWLMLMWGVTIFNSSMKVVSNHFRTKAQQASERTDSLIKATEHIREQTAKMKTGPLFDPDWLADFNARQQNSHTRFMANVDRLFPEKR